MSNEILGERFIARSQPAWHNIAQRIFAEDEVITAEEAMREVAGDVEVVQAPVSFEVDGGVINDKKHVAIVRRPLVDDDEYRVLGYTTDAWKATSYSDLARNLNELAKKYKVETTGVLKKGALAFQCFRVEDWDVRGDEMHSYFVSNYSLQPGIGHRLYHSSVRVVCWNTNETGQKLADINLRIPHVAEVDQRIKLASNIVTRFHEVKEKTKAIFESFADHQITEEDLLKVIAAAFPEPKMPPKLRLLKQTLSAEEAEVFKQQMDQTLMQAVMNDQDKYERDLEKVVKIRETAHERFEAFVPVRLRGTAWAGYNAVTEVSDWRQGPESDFSSLFGSRSREKVRAFIETAKLVGSNN